MDFQLAGKKAVVCAASKGLGRAVALELAREGCAVAVIARDSALLTQVADEIRSASGTQVAALAADLSRLGERERVLTWLGRDFGDVDILVNNIGGPPLSTALETGSEAWQKGFELLFLSMCELTRGLVGSMAERGFGRIVTITSLAAVEPLENLAVSTAMRAAVTAFSKQLATEVAMHGITVNTVMPGLFATDRVMTNRRTNAAKRGSTLEEELARTVSTIPTGRMGRPEEFAAAVAFLCSQRASYVTGLNLAVDGGLRRGWH